MSETRKERTSKAIEAVIAPHIKALDASYEKFRKAAPKLKACTKALEEELKSAESAIAVQTALAMMEEPMGDTAKCVAALSAALKAIAEMMKTDPDVAGAAPKSFLDDIRSGVKELESARDSLRGAKLLKDKAEAFLAQQGRDNDAAAEEWTMAVTVFDGYCQDAAVEAKNFVAWDKDLQSALAARDARRLVQLQKARPASPAMDFLTALTKDKLFADFDKQFDVAALSDALKDEISMDRGKAENDLGRMARLIEARDEIVKRAAAMKIDARDGLKALKVLSLPKTALTKLQAAIDAPEAQMIKLPDAVGRMFKSEMAGKDMLMALKKAAVV